MFVFEKTMMMMLVQQQQDALRHSVHTYQILVAKAQIMLHDGSDGSRFASPFTLYGYASCERRGGSG